MASKFYLHCFFLLLSSVSILGKLEVKLLHVLSANKFYVPDVNHTAPSFVQPKNLSYRYFLENSVDIPNSVKLDLFNLGAHLRRDYDRFLGSLYIDDIIKMQTSEFPVSIIAGELINAGLWPPVDQQIWKEDLLWQPIPFAYKLQEEDTQLLGTLCPNFELETSKVLKSHGNLSAGQTTLLQNINKQLNLNVNNAIDVSLLYLALENSAALKQKLPPMLGGLYPGEFLLNFTMSAYELLGKTALQRQLNGGSLLKAIVSDSKRFLNGSLSANRKINVYSGDERVFMGVLRNLGQPARTMPGAGAALIFELLEESGVYFVKTLYYTGRSEDANLEVTLKGCVTLCPFENFTSIVSQYFPADDLSLCGLPAAIGGGGSGGGGSSGGGSNGGGNKGGNASTAVTSNALIVAVSLITLFATAKLM